VTVTGGRTKRDPNRALLREVAATLGDERWVSQTAVFPSNRPDSVVCTVQEQYYPRQYVSRTYLEIQSYTNGDFHVTYVETQHEAEWMVRWDRHESPDFARDHFHGPPDAHHEDGADRSYPSTLFGVLSQEIVPWLYDRIGSVWDEFNR